MITRTFGRVLPVASSSSKNTRAIATRPRAAARAMTIRVVTVGTAMLKARDETRMNVRGHREGPPEAARCGIGLPQAWFGAQARGVSLPTDIHMEAQSWLAPTELDHARVVDAHGRMRTARAVAGGAIGVALLICQPWLPWWTLGLFLIAAVPLLTFERRLKGSAHPERVAAQTLMLILAV